MGEPCCIAICDMLHLVTTAVPGHDRVRGRDHGVYGE